MCMLCTGRLDLCWGMTGNCDCSVTATLVIATSTGWWLTTVLINTRRGVPWSAPPLLGWLLPAQILVVVDSSTFFSWINQLLWVIQRYGRITSQPKVSIARHAFKVQRGGKFTVPRSHWSNVMLRQNLLTLDISLRLKAAVYSPQWCLPYAYPRALKSTVWCRFSPSRDGICRTSGIASFEHS